MSKHLFTLALVLSSVAAPSAVFAEGYGANQAATAVESTNPAVVDQDGPYDSMRAATFEEKDQLQSNLENRIEQLEAELDKVRNADRNNWDTIRDSAVDTLEGAEMSGLPTTGSGVTGVNSKIDSDTGPFGPDSPNMKDVGTPQEATDPGI